MVRESLLAQMWHRNPKKICKEKVNEVEDKQEEALIAFDNHEYAHLTKSREEKGIKKAHLQHLVDTSSFDKNFINCKVHPKICLTLLYIVKDDKMLNEASLKAVP